MGGSQSVSHFAHPDARHRFKLVESQDLNTKVTCRMCWEEIKPGVAAYRCQQCASGFFIHDVCFHRQQTIESHWAHAAHPSHPLTLSTTGHRQNHQQAGPSSDPVVLCTLCARDLDPRAFAYVCSRRTGDGHDCHGFSAHPGCCVDVSRKLMVPEWHKHELTLLSPLHHHDRQRRLRSTCLNPQCRTAGADRDRRQMTTAAEPWSYQCTPCKVHLCLPCRLQGEGDGPPNQQNLQPSGRCGKDLVIEIFGCMGDAVGTFGRRFTCACMGNPAV